MPTLQYPNNPNTDTAFVVQDDGTKNRALMTAPQDTSTLELPSNPNSTKGYVTIDGKKQRVVLTADISGGGSGGDQHNLGWYATESALTTAHPTAEAGDWAIVGATDTVWIWDTDNSQWVDSDQKGQVTSVNNQTGDVTITGADILPSQTGNAGKFLVTDGTDASWSNEIKSTDANVSAILILKSQNNDYAQFYKRNSTTTNLFGISVYKNNTYNAGIDFSNNSIIVSAGSVRFGFHQTDRSFYGLDSNTILGTSSKKWANVYTTKINNGADITVPSVGGTLALQIATLPTAGSTYEGTIYQFTGTTDSTYTNGHFYKCVSDGGNPATYSWEEVSMGGGSTGTTASLVVANWSSNTQTVNVTGVTASNNVIVAPAPASQADYTAAGIICTAQGAGTLTFTCTTVPSSAITVNVLII